MFSSSTIQKRDKNPARVWFVLPVCVPNATAMKTENNCLLRETKRWLRKRHGSYRAGVAARDEKVIAREDGYTYIAALRSPDLRHTTKREGDTSVTVVTSNNL